jgi:hypothetical protein
MAGHSRSKNGVASLAYIPAIHGFPATRKTWMRGTSPRMTVMRRQAKRRINDCPKVGVYRPVRTG